MSDKKCYTCNEKILYYDEKNETNIMILWNRESKILCNECFKSYSEGIEIYQKNNPEWVRPKAKEK